MTPRESKGRAGFQAIEIAVATLIAAAVAIPVMTLLFQGRETEQLSRLRSLALLAAHDEMFECRMALAAGALPEGLAHDWRPLVGNVLERLAAAGPGVAIDAVYGPDQSRISTRLTLEPATPSRIRLATLEVRWLDTGPDAGTAAADGRPTSMQLVFGLMTPGGP